MLIQVDHRSGVPVYKQIIQQISFHIASQLIQAGQPLPSVRALSHQLGVNPMTVSKAYSFLEHDGFVKRRPGRPLIVTLQSNSTLITERKAHLERALRPAVIISKQLGLSPHESLATFRDMLEGQ